MNLKRIIIDTDNGERFIYEDFTRGTYLDLSQSSEPVSIDDGLFDPRGYISATTGEYMMWLNLRADTLTITEALPGNTDYDWLLETNRRNREQLDTLRRAMQEFTDGVASALGFDEKISELQAVIDALRQENERLQDNLDAEYDRRWSE